MHFAAVENPQPPSLSWEYSWPYVRYYYLAQRKASKTPARHITGDVILVEDPDLQQPVLDAIIPRYLIAGSVAHPVVIEFVEHATIWNGLSSGA